MVDLPCRPTISATCSEDGTGTHSVMFCDFLARSSGGGAKPSGLARGFDDGRLSPKFSMLSSRASCRARWSSTRPPPPISPKRLVGISTCEAILSVKREVSLSVTGILSRSLFAAFCHTHVRCCRVAAENWVAGRRAPAPCAARGACRGRGRRGVDCRRGRDASQLPPALPPA